VTDKKPKTKKVKDEPIKVGDHIRTSGGWTIDVYYVGYSRAIVEYQGEGKLMWMDLDYLKQTRKEGKKK
jgi:hypothetical protein